MGPLDRFLDFRRVHSMPVNMADIVQIPIEALNAIEHSHGIYNYCMYNKTLHSVARALRKTSGQFQPQS